MANVGELTIELNLDDRNFNRNLSTGQRRVNNIGGAFSGLNNIIGSTSGILGNLSGLFAGGLAIGGATMALDLLKTAFVKLGEAIKNVIADGIKYNAYMENSTAKFKVMLGSQEQAVKMMKEISGFAEVTPFGEQDLVQAASMMKSFGIETEKIMSNLQRLGDVALGDKEAFKGLTLAFSQIQSQGKLMGQDLLQMINNQFNPLQIISEQTGISMGKLKDTMSKGGISANLVSAAFEAATSKIGDYHKGMENLSKTFDGRMSTLSDTLKKLKGELTKPFFEFLASQVIPRIQVLLEGLGKVLPVILDVAVEVFSEWKKLIMNDFAPAIYFLKNQWELFGKGFVKMTVLLLKNLSATARSISYIVDVSKKTAFLTIKAFLSMGNFIQDIFVGIITSYNSMIDKLKPPEKLRNMLNMMGPFGKALNELTDMDKLKLEPKLFNFDKIEELVKKFLFSTDTGFKELGETATESTGELKNWKKIFEDLLKAGAGDGEKELKKLQSVFNNLKKSIESSADSFVNFVNIFDKVQKVKISARSVFRRLEGQVKEMKNWRENILALRQKLGQDNPLFQQLLKEGPAKAGEIAAVNRLSAESLQKYNDMFAQKMAIGTQGAVIQQAGMMGLGNRDVTINITGNNINDTIDLKILANMMIKEMKLAGVK